MTNSPGCLYFISIQEMLVIKTKNFLLMFHFPQYVPIKRRPSAVNIITANLNGHISQMFWYYTFPKVLCVLRSLDKIACECSHQFIIQVLARTECLQHNNKSNYITRMSFIVCFLILEAISLQLKRKKRGVKF